MSNRTSYIFAYGILAIIIIALIAYLALKGGAPSSSTAPATSQTSPATTSVQTIGPVTFACDAGKSIEATFNNVQNGTSSVSLVLSDGRATTVPQTISGSGARYANAGETFVFWNKGNAAFIEEGDTNVPSPTETYQNCVVATSSQQ
ncbi:MAG: MliC family protein [Minisyncoccia bacterium]